MVDRSNINDKTIIIADRGYESYNVFEHIVKKNWNYVIRVKDIYSIGIVSGISTPDKEMFYIEHSILLTRRQTKDIKADYIIQEIFARLTMYNFCEIITTHVVIQQKNRKYSYQVNFTMAILICMQYFKCSNVVSPPNVETLIKTNILPVRNGRKDPCKVKTKSAVSFIYRVA